MKEYPVVVDKVGVESSWDSRVRFGLKTGPSSYAVHWIFRLVTRKGYRLPILHRLNNGPIKNLPNLIPIELE